MNRCSDVRKTANSSEIRNIAVLIIAANAFRSINRSHFEPACRCQTRSELIYLRNTFGHRLFAHRHVQQILAFPGTVVHFRVFVSIWIRPTLIAKIVTSFVMVPNRNSCGHISQKAAASIADSDFVFSSFTSFSADCFCSHTKSVYPGGVNMLRRLYCRHRQPYLKAGCWVYEHMNMQIGCISRKICFELIRRRAERQKKVHTMSVTGIIHFAWQRMENTWIQFMIFFGRSVCALFVSSRLCNK